MSDTVSVNWVKSVARMSIVIAAIGGLAACGTVESLNPFRNPDKPRQVPLDDRIGFVAADEPVAAAIGANILKDGGTAADAAVATYFAMAVTYPSGTGLGGGGICLYADKASRTTTTIEFMPAPTVEGGLVQNPVPGSVAGMDALHQLAGAMPWATLLAPAEVMARNGYKASRARARATAALPPAFRGRAELDSLTKTANGQKIEEESRLIDPMMAETLLQLRSRGAADFYVGKLASRIVNEASRNGIKITLEDLKNYLPAVSGSDVFNMPDGRVVVPRTSSSARRLLQAIVELPEFRRKARGLSPAGRADFARAIEKQARLELGFGNVPEDARTGSATFVTTDRMGNTASCAFTTYGALGSGIMAGDMGFTFASPIASPAGVAARLGLMPIMVLDRSGVEIGAAAAGGPGAVSTLAALFSTRVVESDTEFTSAVRQATHARGRSMNAVACNGTGSRLSGIGSVLGFAPSGPRRSANCVGESASSGFGLAIGAYPNQE